MWGSDFDDLKGQEILSVSYTEEHLNFILKDKTVSYKAVGDCCSSSYIESLDNPEVFNKAIFQDVETVEGKEEERKDCEVLKWTFYKFKTSKGACTLSFRNESNGYYNGWLERVTA
jgi:hypothetical protein